MNEYKEAQLFEIKHGENSDPKKDISLDFHSLKKKQNLQFVRRGSNTSITSQVTSKSQFTRRGSNAFLKLIKEDNMSVKQRNIENIKNIFKVALLGRVILPRILIYSWE